MRSGIVMAGVLATLLGAGALGAYLTRQAAEPPGPRRVAAPMRTDGNEEHPSRSPGSREVAGPTATPVPAPLPPRPLKAAVDGILRRFRDAWEAPLQLQGEPRREGLRRRSVEVAALAEELSRLGEGIVTESRIRIRESGCPHEERLFFARGLSLEGSKAALRLLAEEAASPGQLRWRLMAYEALVQSEGPEAQGIALGTLMALRDPRFLLAPLQADLDPDRVEGAYRAWLGNSEVKERTRSYSMLPRFDAEWIGPLLVETADSGLPVPERAGAVAALGTPGRFEGALEILTALLWKEEDPVLIRALVVAIKRLGGDEARRALEAYAEAGAPEELRDMVLSTARSQRQLKPIPSGEGKGVGRKTGQAFRLDPEKRHLRVPR